MPDAARVIVVGGGHAGIEAAHAAARLGARVVLLTQNAATIGTMSCNPAVGGTGKGQLVRELDALGGVMALGADAAGLMFQTLNLGKGEAVRSPRVQCDKHAYRRVMRASCESRPGLTVVEGEAAAVWTDGSGLRGVTLTDGSRLEARCVVLTTGTFLNGLAHTGLRSAPAGRAGEAPSVGLSASLRGLGLEVGRLKTGTPPRLDGRTVDWSKLRRQDGDAPPQPLSFRTARLEVEQLPCWLTRTTEATHAVIRSAFDRSPLFTGAIKASGPRYCPSVEDKVSRFPDKDGHRVFLEPEGRDTPEVYANGLSTSLPEDAQAALVATVPGLERAVILRHGYAIEYDFCPPDQLTPGLETKAVARLFLAGQINGTTGYEEAAAQGLVAGVNAARAAAGEAPVLWDRAESYLGVMVDDLVTKGVDEPYRMFTARAENRLRLRADNADLRLMPRAFALGLLPESLLPAFERYREAVETGVVRGGMGPWTEEKARAQRATIAAYAHYIAREEKAAAARRGWESVALPADADWRRAGSLGTEALQKLARVRPRTLGQAARIPGLTPADVQSLWVLTRAS
ncbi:MAG: tRNA uridine-5-carboxymethylaminomethyl(34) synthesis enzyme MnmG [Elusimicrobiota bacterium]|nr:tRNA uridine-5-carboxymethylaminomethyl(34) synthesis enzyme MnmG [Elusimicrobiota bacterium]